MGPDCQVNGASVGESLSAFIAAKRRCRTTVIGKAGVKHKTRLLVESLVFCKSLFPPDKVKEVLDLARKDNISLRKCWQMPMGKYHFPSSFPSFTSPFKRKFKGNWPQDNKRHQISYDNKSPATNPVYEAKGKTSWSKGKKTDNKADKSSQFKSKKPFQGKLNKPSPN